MSKHDLHLPTDRGSETARERFEGAGAIEQLAGILPGKSRRKSRNVFVVHGKSFGASGARAALERIQNIELHSCERRGNNPDVRSVASAYSAYRAFQPDVMIAAGGGAAIDTAKAILVYAFGYSRNTVFSGENRIPEDRPLFVAIPTTAGSGSEETHFALVVRDGMEIALAHGRLRPDIVVLDPALTFSCPEAATLSCAAGAICQCVESWWAAVGGDVTAERADSTAGDDRTAPHGGDRAAASDASTTAREHAERGLSLLLPGVFAAVETPEDIEIRERLLSGANAAGRGADITGAGTGHVLSSGLAGGFGVPHGLAHLAVMQQLIAQAGENTRSGLQGLDRAFAEWGDDFASGFDRFAEAIWQRVELAAFFSDVDARSYARALRQLVKSVNEESLGGGPVALDAEAVRSIYERLLARHAAGR